MELVNIQPGKHNVSHYARLHRASDMDPLSDPYTGTQEGSASWLVRVGKVGTTCAGRVDDA